MYLSYNKHNMIVSKTGKIPIARENYFLLLCHVLNVFLKHDKAICKQLLIHTGKTT